MTYDELLALARSADGKTLRTITGKEFRVGTYLDSLVFTPHSTGQGRSDGRAAQLPALTPPLLEPSLKPNIVRR